MMQEQISLERERAQEVKREAPVVVCLGNPPYDREQRDPDSDEGRRKGGWVRYGDDGESAPPILEDFLAPARAAGAGVHLKNLYNDYVYFWRWALWKVFDSTDDPGIVTFITASSYLRGPGFVGMRRKMREVFDELWIIDLEGDSLGARKTDNVFAIRTPGRHCHRSSLRPAILRHAGEGSQDQADRLRTREAGNTRWSRVVRRLGLARVLTRLECPLLPGGDRGIFRLAGRYRCVPMAAVRRESRAYMAHQPRTEFFGAALAATRLCGPEQTPSPVCGPAHRAKGDRFPTRTTPRDRKTIQCSAVVIYGGRAVRLPLLLPVL